MRSEVKHQALQGLSSTHPNIFCIFGFFVLLVGVTSFTTTTSLWPTLHPRRNSEREKRGTIYFSRTYLQASKHLNSEVTIKKEGSPLDNEENARVRIAVIGGGASGMFAAASAAESLQELTSSSSSKSQPPAAAWSITVLESSPQLMSKVKVSGGGRCNVLHDTNIPPTNLLSTGYPRGQRELRGILSKRFTPTEAQEWFERRGVKLKTEEDGRMFPVTNDSQTVMDAIQMANLKGGVVVRTGWRVQSVCFQENDKNNKSTDVPALPRFVVQLKDKPPRTYNYIIMATGSSPAGHAMAHALGHTIVNPVPSLFTFNVQKKHLEEGGILHGLSGLTLPKVRIWFEKLQENTPDQADKTTPKKKKSRKKKKKTQSIFQEGPALITHFGLSGPAPLKLSSFGAREFHESAYRGTLHLHLSPDVDARSMDKATSSWERVADEFQRYSTLPDYRRKLVRSGCPLVLTQVEDTTTTTNNNNNKKENNHHDTQTPPPRSIPRRLWANLCDTCDIPPTLNWSSLSKAQLRALSCMVSDCPLHVVGKNTFKEEFVTAGGVSLKEIDMTCMESKVCGGLFFVGEMVNVDGITGGFNFMNCWGTGFVAGRSVAAKVMEFLQERE